MRHVNRKSHVSGSAQRLGIVFAIVKGPEGAVQGEEKGVTRPFGGDVCESIISYKRGRK